MKIFSNSVVKLAIFRLKSGAEIAEKLAKNRAKDIKTEKTYKNWVKKAINRS
jgi:hypothetical protein